MYPLKKIRWFLGPIYLTNHDATTVRIDGYCSNVIMYLLLLLFLQSPELLLDEEGRLHVIRERQSVDQMWQNEVDIQKGII